MSGHQPGETIRDRTPWSPGREERVAVTKRAMKDAMRLVQILDGPEPPRTVLLSELSSDLPTPVASGPGPELYISTLRAYVEDLGGRLELAAVFDGGCRLLIGG